MTPLIISIASLVVALVSLAMLVRLSMRQGSGGGQREDLERLREQFDRTLRESSQNASDAQRKLATDLTENIQRVREDTKDAVNTGLTAASEQISRTLAEARKSQDERLDRVENALRTFEAAFQKNVAELQERQSASALQQRESLTQTLSGLQDRVQLRLEEVRKENAEQLEKIRGTVEEKLQSTLEARLGESFKLVSERLEKVHQGLGDMQRLATGVGDLKNLLQNVRSRGTFGEVQLQGLLDEVFTPQQYLTNVATVPGSSERVEFAIRLPGRGETDSEVLLPIDAKFPQEDYLRLQQAYESADPAGVEAARNGLRTRLIAEGQKIHNKYVSPPHTTDFAVLFLPTEGLYAEAVRLEGLCEELQTRWRIMPVGPTNLLGLLNSLQMGFRTLAIEKRSSEVWKVLAAVKTEFGKFGEALDGVQKKLSEAGNKIGDVSRRTRVMGRKLESVESLPAAETAAILDLTPDVSSLEELPPDS